jgi:FkbM family methyltransferase
MLNLTNFNTNFKLPILDIFKKYHDPLPRPQPSDIIVNIFDHKRELFFVDVGAHNGINGSNSLVLEEGYDWRGLCIEPSTVLYKKLLECRKCICLNVGISTETTDLEFAEIIGASDALSGFIKYFTAEHKARIERELANEYHRFKKILVQSVPLQKIFNERGITHVDYLSIDAECADFEVIKSVDFAKTHVSVLSHETQTGKDNNDTDKQIAEYLSRYGFTHFQTCYSDCIYINRGDFEII